MSDDKSSWRRICELATPGPLEVGPYYTYDGHGHGRYVHDVTGSGGTVAEAVSQADANLFVIARTALLACLDRIDRLEQLCTEACDLAVYAVNNKPMFPRSILNDIADIRSAVRNKK